MGRGFYSQLISDADYIAKLKSKCVIAPSGCWLWQGYCHPKGYGEMSYRGESYRTHRLSYMLHKGQIPDGYQVCHSCDVRNCCNPDHLWIGTNNDNVQDMRRKRRGNKQKKTHCWRGHPLAGDNLYVSKRGHRSCNTCQRARQRIKKGWSEEMALSIPTVPHGHRVVART